MPTGSGVRVPARPARAWTAPGAVPSVLVGFCPVPGVTSSSDFGFSTRGYTDPGGPLRVIAGGSRSEHCLVLNQSLRQGFRSDSSCPLS